MIYVDFELEKMSNRNLLWTENSKDYFFFQNGDIERANFRWTIFKELEEYFTRTYLPHARTIRLLLWAFCQKRKGEGEWLEMESSLALARKPDGSTRFLSARLGPTFEVRLASFFVPKIDLFS